MLDGFRQDLKKPGVQRRALIIAAIVGTLLNCINQGVDVMQGHTLHAGKAVLTYMVPYCVSVYSSIAASRNLK